MASTLTAGQTIDRFRLIKRLGQGGMAEVFLAEEIALKRPVVLKFILPHLMNKETLLSRFEREAQVTARLNHPNIVQVYTTGTLSNGRLYIALQYIDGGTLTEALDRLAQQQRQIPTLTALEMMRQMAVALTVAHQAGIVHRDLKPSNILLQKDGTAVLADLGIAALQSEVETRLTQTGHMPGTPSYMSPEQAKGQPLDGRSDIYSLGVILYELLAGKRPFAADTPWAIIHQHINEPPPPLRRQRPDLSAETIRVVDTCLQKAAANRYATARELVAALERAIAAEQAPAAPTTQLDTLNPIAPPAKKWQKWAWAILLIPLLLLLGWGGVQLYGNLNLNNGESNAGVITRISSPTPTSTATLAATATDEPAPTSTATIAATPTAAATTAPTPTRALNSPRILRGHDQAVLTLAFTPDGQTIASADQDGLINLWTLAERLPVPTILQGHSSTVFSLAISPDGNTLASASADTTVRLWNLADVAAEPLILRAHSDFVYSVAFSPDGSRLASAGQDGLIRLWDTANLSAEPLILQGHTDWVLTVAFSLDGDRLASSSTDDTVRVWNLTNLNEDPIIFSASEHRVRSIAFSPDGSTLATASFDTTVRLWSLANPTAEPTVLQGHDNGVSAVAFSPNGRLLASASDDATIRLWDLLDLAAEPIILRGHDFGIRTAAFSPDGTTLASGSTDDTIRLWNLAALPTP